jgi:hypothetical protein
MITELTLDKSTKGLIIDILTKEYPLTAKQIHNRIKKAGISMSYHGVYSSLSELVSTSVILKEKTGYELSHRWVDSTCTKMENIRIKHEIEPILNDLKVGDVRTLHFKSYKEYVNFVRTYMSHFIKNANPKEKNTISWLVKHATRGIFNTEDNIDLANKIKEKDIDLYVLVSGNTAMDKMVKIADESMGLKNMKIGAPNNFGMIISVYNDVAICAILSQKEEKQMDKLFEESNAIEGDIFKVPQHVAKISNHIAQMKDPVKVLVVKNPELVKTYQDYVLTSFADE